MAVTQKPNCKFRKYEMMRLSWLRRELNAAMLRWDEDKIDVKVEDAAYGNEMKDAVVSIIDHLEQDFTDIKVAGEQLWEVYGVLQRKVDQVLECFNELKLPPVKTDILKNTDAGPGVGSSNVEVRYRDAEMDKILNSDRVDRVHISRDDSGQNEAEIECMYW